MLKMFQTMLRRLAQNLDRATRHVRVNRGRISELALQDVEQVAANLHISAEGIEQRLKEMVQ
jgi:predicted metal-dependent hydrolase